MGLEFDSAEDASDRTKWLWIGVGLLVVVLVGTLMIWGRMNPAMSLVRARHILIKYDRQDPSDRDRALNLAEELRDRIENGESFTKLAKEYSSDPHTARRGGDMNFIPKGKLVATVEDYVWRAPLHELSPIIHSEFGYHIIEVMDRHLSKTDKYEMDMKHKAVGGEN
jgi:parvulin-like peptidyl-prolyl isomerase